MDLLEAMQKRHSVRSFTDRKIDAETEAELRRLMEAYNKESGLHMQLITNEPKAFDGMMAHYGKFSGCTDYIALVGKKGAEENCGYYGEKIVLKAQQLGLNSCWVAMTYSKSKAPCVSYIWLLRSVMVKRRAFPTGQSRCHSYVKLAVQCRIGLKTA